MKTKKILTLVLAILLIFSTCSFLTAIAQNGPRFVVLQDFENTTVEDAFGAHKSPNYNAAISTDYSADGTKSLKITKSDSGWSVFSINLDTSDIDLSQMSTIIAFLKMPATCTQESGAQAVARFGVLADGAEKYSNSLGKIYDASTGAFIDNDYSYGQGGDTIWFSPANSKEIAVVVPIDGTFDKTKITSFFMYTHEPKSGQSLYIDRIVGVEGAFDNSLGFVGEGGNSGGNGGGGSFGPDGFKVLQDFENTTAGEAFGAHKSPAYNAAISTEYAFDGTKSLKVTKNNSDWGVFSVNLNTANIDLSRMSTIIAFLKLPASCTQESGTQVVAQFGVLADGQEKLSNSIGKIYDVASGNFIDYDYSAGNGNMIWFSPANSKEIAVVVPIDSNFDKTKITSFIMYTHEPKSGQSLYVDRIVGVQGDYDNSLGFTGEGGSGDGGNGDGGNGGSNNNFAVIQDFENISAEDAFKGHNLFDDEATADATAEITEEFKVDGTKSLKITGTVNDQWRFKFFKVDVSQIDAENLSTVIMFIKYGEKCTPQGHMGGQAVSRFGVYTTDGYAYYCNNLGKIYDADLGAYIDNDYSSGQKNMTWFFDARNKLIAYNIPLDGMTKNPSNPGPELDKSKIEYIFIETHEPQQNVSMYIDRIVGVIGPDDGSTGFAPSIELPGAPEVTTGLYMLEDFDKFAKDTDLLGAAAVSSTPRKGAWAQKPNGQWYFDGIVGTAVASDDFAGIGGVSAKFEYPDGLLTWADGGECAFKAPIQQYGPVTDMSGIIVYVKTPGKNATSATDTLGFKPGFEGNKGSDFAVLGLKDGSYVKVISGGETNWKYVAVNGVDIQLPYDWEGYIQLPFDSLVVTHPSPDFDVSMADSSFSPAFYAYIEYIGGESGAAYLDDIMAYTRAFNTEATDFLPADWEDRECASVGTLTKPGSDEITIDKILDEINNTDNDIVITSTSPYEISSVIFEALQGEDQNIIVEVTDGEKVLYSWTINGKDITNTEDDFETNILLNGSFFQDAIVELTGFDPFETTFITTVEDELPAEKAILRIYTGLEDDTEINAYLYDFLTEDAEVVKQGLTVEGGYVSFEITMGGEYFLSEGNYKISDVKVPDTSDTTLLIFVTLLMASMIMIGCLTVRTAKGKK